MVSTNTGKWVWTNCASNQTFYYDLLPLKKNESIKYWIYFSLNRDGSYTLYSGGFGELADKVVRDYIANNSEPLKSEDQCKQAAELIASKIDKLLIFM